MSVHQRSMKDVRIIGKSPAVGGNPKEVVVGRGQSRGSSFGINGHRRLRRLEELGWVKEWTGWSGENAMAVSVVTLTDEGLRIRQAYEDHKPESIGELDDVLQGRY